MVKLYSTCVRGCSSTHTRDLTSGTFRSLARLHALQGLVWGLVVAHCQYTVTEIASLICKFCLSVTTCAVDCADLSLLLLVRSPAISTSFTILVRCLRTWLYFYSNHWGSHIQSSWMVHAGCVFVAIIHLSRTWMWGSFESVWWNACVHRQDLGLYSHPKEFFGNGVRTHVNSNGKIPSMGKNPPQRRTEPMTLHNAGHQAQHTTNWAIPALDLCLRCALLLGDWATSMPISFHHIFFIQLLHLYVFKKYLSTADQFVFPLQPPKSSECKDI